MAKKKTYKKRKQTKKKNAIERYEFYKNLDNSKEN